MNALMRILIVSLFVLACGESKKIDSHPPMALVGSFDTSFIAVLPLNSIVSTALTGAKSADLSVNEFAVVDSLLKKSVDQYNKEQVMRYKNSSQEKAYLIDLSTHKRQYVTMVNEKGEKLVWVNCFCNAWDKNWKKELISVLDGGVCYFNLKINLATNSYYELFVNGIG